MKISSEHLEILAAIVELGGLAEGAEAMGKSQPSVSRSMAFLERRIGMPLFEPGRRPLRPTELGTTLARLGTQIRAANQEAERSVQHFRQGRTGLLRVGGSPVFMDGVVSSMIAHFQTHFSDVRIEQSYGYLDSLAAALLNETLDVAILPTHISQVPEKLSFVPLLPGNNVIACRTGHPLTALKNLALSDVAACAWISPPVDSPLFRDLQSAVKKIGQTDFRVSFSGGTLASILSVLVGSDELTVLPYSVVFQLRHIMPLAVLPVRLDHPNRELGLLTTTEHQKKPALKQFMDFMTAELLRLHHRMEHEHLTTRRG